MEQRSTYVDILKGWTILLVVVGHVVQRADVMGIWPWHYVGAAVPRFLATGSMPLFIAISGYLTFGRVRDPLGTWIAGKARLLLIPWLMWTVAYWFLVRDRLIPTTMPFGAYMRAQFAAPTLWYLVVLFMCCLVVGLGLKVGEWTLPVIGVAMMIVSLPVAWMTLLQWYYWSFIGGYFFARFQARLLAMRWLAWAMAVPVLAIGFIPMGPSGSVQSLLITGVGAALASTLIAWVLTRTSFTRPFVYLGIHSLEIYVGQFLFIQLLLVRSPANTLVTAALAVAGSLALGYLLHSNRVTDTLFLGGKKVPALGA